jgi:tripartite-type tricarboxylate transporter receptor subunit TctC
MSAASQISSGGKSLVPVATPRDVASKLTAELNRVIANPEVTRKLQEFGLEPIPGSAEQMTA